MMRNIFIFILLLLIGVISGSLMFIYPTFSLLFLGLSFSCGWLIGELYIRGIL